jgi:uncharacterized protein DUF5994
MLATITGAPALDSPPRLLLTQRKVSRAVLDGAWWPRSWDAPVELSGLGRALSERYGQIRYVILNGSAWTGRVRRLAVDDHVLRIGWFASMSKALLIATTDTGDQVDLLIVPPHLAPELAEQAMVQAADPANIEHAPDLLARVAGPDTAVEPTRSTAAGAAEAVWDNEGGSARPASAGRAT